jgi:hypothetical protein
VPEDRLRKLSPENRELANNLRHEVLAAQRAAAAKPAAAIKKKPQGSARGSEERQSSVSAAVPRGQKRMRDQDLEKVSSPDALAFSCFSHSVRLQPCQTTQSDESNFYRARSSRTNVK